MASHLPRLVPEQTALAVIDVQDRLAAAMDGGVRKVMLRNLKILLATARQLKLRVAVTEQYPQGLGPTLTEVREALGEEVAAVTKLAFSACEAPGFRETVERARAKSVILTGMETHVCVLQTAQGLLEAGYEVWIAQDAVASRTKASWKSGLALAERAGAFVATTETLVFMLLRTAGTPAFKALSPIIK